jgi:hypothetical protein
MGNPTILSIDTLDNETRGNGKENIAPVSITSQAKF